MRLFNYQFSGEDLKMGKKLYVGSIPFTATEEDLSNLFSTIGEVESVKIITDQATGRSKGFGFVEMTTDEAAMKAMEELNGKPFMERSIVVNEARPQQPREKRGFGGRGGGGGRGFDRGGRGGGGGSKGRSSGGGRGGRR